jgi:hypothetical protein
MSQINAKVEKPREILEIDICVCRKKTIRRMLDVGKENEKRKQKYHNKKPHFNISPIIVKGLDCNCGAAADKGPSFQPPEVHKQIWSSSGKKLGGKQLLDGKLSQCHFLNHSSHRISPRR